MAMVKTFVPLLIATKGLIINISSAASLVAYPFASAYSASKGALNAFSRTLRVELRPYGVRVLVAITGTVRTNINLQTDRTLPPGSLYTPIADVYQWRLTFSRNTPSAVAPEAYAARLVRDALKPDWHAWLRGVLGWGRPDWHYFGGLARTVWFGTCVGEWLTDALVYRKFRLDALAKVLRERGRPPAETSRAIKEE